MQSNGRNVTILFFTLVVIMLGFGMVIPILPFYVKHFSASGSALGGLMATYGVMQFIFAPIWGSLSDRYGRKPILMVGVLGNAVSQILFGLSSQLWMLFAARTLAGMLSSATLPTAMAYIGDSTSHEERSGKMGLIGAAMGLGMVLGPGLGGWLASGSLSLPFFLAGGLSLLALVLVFLVLPEPTRPAHAEHRALSGPRPGVLWASLTGPIGILFLIAFLLSFGLTNFEGVFGLYAADRYQYGPEQVGGVLTVVGLISAIVQGAVTGPVTRRWGEVAVIRLALFSTAAGFVLMLQARTYPQVLLTVGYFVLSNAMLNPTVNSLISKRTTSGQGMAMGLANSFLSLGRIAGPLWAGFAYDANMSLPYLTGAAIMLIGCVLSLAMLSAQPAPRPVLAPGWGDLTAEAQRAQRG